MARFTTAATILLATSSLYNTNALLTTPHPQWQTTTRLSFGKSKTASTTSLQMSLEDNTVAALDSIAKYLPNDILQSLRDDTKLRSSLQSIDSYLQSDDLVGSLQESLKTLPPPVLLLGSAIVTYGVITAILEAGKPRPPPQPYPLKRYDAVSARRYFDANLVQVLKRAVEVTWLSLGFGVNLAGDYFGNKLSSNADIRATQLSTLLTKLGPSFIKIGQSLSIRTDLLSPAYVRGLKTLQDQVPPFPTSEAIPILEAELGAPISKLFKEFSREPVAAASLGQVYKATLQDGREVAIKIQRPNIMNQIALDMYLIREVVPVLKRVFNLNTDLVGVVDTWGVGFVDELNYLSEGQNAIQFTNSMKSTPLANVVFAPPVLEELSTDKVLVTEWVDGERLDKSAQEDVTILCSIAMNTYLSMMLETGVLHCDPHPGNLLRTPDGKLCILDWGMVTKLDPDLQITLIEHMAHLTSADYEEIPRDLLLLGFIPPSKADLITDSGIVETLADIYGAWTQGGGAAKINVNKVVSQLQDLTATRGNLFQIPPYFAYIAKSFSVLEGIGLSNDPEYSIINECLPYVSKRLLTDQSERTGGALSTFIFGPDKNERERIVDYDRVEQLVTGFGDYSTSASGALMGKEDVKRVELLEQGADQILELLVTEEETPLQSIFLEQLAKIVASTSKSVWSQLRERSGTLPSGRTVLGTLVDPLGFWRTSPIIQMNELDEKTLVTTRNLITLIQKQSQNDANSPVFDVSTLSNEEVVELSRILVRKVWEKRAGVMETSKRFGRVLIELTAEKLEKGERRSYALESNQDERDETKEPMGETTMTTTARDSRRLEGARRILAELEEEGDEKTMEDMPAAVPVSNVK